MRILFVFMITSLVITLATKSTEDRIGCRGEDGEIVDWYYLYKLSSHYPTSKDNGNNTHGLRYIYITSKSFQQGWQLSNHLINESTSFPGQTINPILSDPNSLLIFYNDETPSGDVNNDDGHTKGVVAANENYGFWLIHSVPKFPNAEKYDYPKTGIVYGQSFLCISMNRSEMDLVGEQLIFNEPNIYHSQIPDDLKIFYPNLIHAINKDWRKNPPYWNDLIIVSQNGTSFRSFAKSRRFHKELYLDWVAPTLNSNLLVETWRHGPGNLPTNCTRKYHVLNISNLKVDKLKFEFASTNDHSKWAITDNKSEDWICIGDINRSYFLATPIITWWWNGLPIKFSHNSCV